MTVAIFGGSFDPVHEGHVALAEAVRAECGYDLVVLVPAKRPPHKSLSGGASDGDRLAMLRLAVGNRPGFLVDSCELEREGLSWTVDTVRHVISSLKPEGKPGLVIGDDLAAGFSGWREPDTIASECDIILARRLSSTPPPFPFPHRTVTNDIVSVSSSEIRAAAARGTFLPDSLHPGVRDYIERKGLYGYARRGR